MAEVLVDESSAWARAVRGDGQAFAWLFDAYRDVVFRQSLRVISDVSEAEEVAAAAFFELWRRREVVRLVDGSVLPWLLVTATNLGRNRRRSVSRREAAAGRLVGAAVQRRDEAAFERIDADISRGALVQALRRLQPRDAALLTLTVLDGYSVAEVAELVGLSEGAARVRLHRTRQRLRQVLGPQFREEQS